MQVLLVLLLSFVLGLNAFGQGGPTAVDAFTASWTMDMSYNVSFGNERIPGYNPERFLHSDPISPWTGKISFNYPTAELRLEINEGPGAPWKFHTTTIVHSNSCKKGPNHFNCTANIYQTAGLDMCWYYTQTLINIPNQMGGNLNLTYNGTAKIGKQECMVWRTPGGSEFFVSLVDLAIVGIDLPFLLNEVAPIFGFFGMGTALTKIRLHDIVVGTPPSSQFAIPKGQCIHTPYGPIEVEYSKLVSSHMKALFGGQGIFSSIANWNPLKWLSKKLDILSEKSMSMSLLSAQKRFSRPGPGVKGGPFPPHLNQVFSAKWFLNASQDIRPPYTPYTMSGTLAFDFQKSGLSFAITSQTGNLPFNIQFEWRLHPSRNGLEFLQIGPDGTNCYSYLFFQWIVWLLVPQFEIPFDAAQEPSVIIDGQKCSVWQTTYDWFQQFAELYVRESDGTLIQATLPEPLGQGLATMILSDIQTTVSPSAYARPATCVETMDWNTAWDSHLPWDWCDPYC